MGWILVAVLAVCGAVCGAVMRLPVFVIALIGAAVVVMLSNWSQGGGTALLWAVIAVVSLQSGYAAGIVVRSLLRSLRGRGPQQAGVVQQRVVQLQDKPKQR